MTDERDPLEKRIADYGKAGEHIELSRAFQASTLADLRSRHGRGAPLMLRLLGTAGAAAVLLAGALVFHGRPASVVGTTPTPVMSSVPGSFTPAPPTPTPTFAPPTPTSAPPSASPTAVATPTPTGSGAPLFFDDFSADTVGAAPDDGWAVLTGTARINGGDAGHHLLHLEGSAIVTNGDPGWTDVSTMVSVRLTSSASVATVAARYVSPGVAYTCELSTTHLTLNRLNNGVAVHLATQALSTPPGTFVTLGINAKGSALTCGVAGQPKLTATDGVITSGKLALSNSGSVDVASVVVHRAI